MHGISIAVAVYNEEESLPFLCEKLHAVMSGLGKTYEIVLVDDGSTDTSWKVMNEQAGKYPNLKLVKFRRNYGQTAAMSAGINESDGAVLITLDADLQNDPADIPALLAKLDEGYDVVSGWRKDRQDAFINRKLPSMIANKLITALFRLSAVGLGALSRRCRCPTTRASTASRNTAYRAPCAWYSTS